MRGGKRGDDHEVSILIRIGGGERVGRGPSKNVSVNDHPAAATRASARRQGRFSLAVGLGVRALGRDFGRGERLAGSLDVARSNRSSEQTIVADAMEAAGQHVQEKAADELGRVERHGLEPVAAFDPVVLPFEGDARLVERDQPGVGDGDAVGVAREIGEDGFLVRRRVAWRRPPTRSGAKARARRRRRACRRGVRDRRRRRAGRPDGGLRGHRETGGGTGARARARAGRSRACRRSSALPSGDRPPPGTMTWTWG